MGYDIGMMIKQIRVKHRMNQTDFVAALNDMEPKHIRFNTVNLSRYENGQHMIRADKFLKILHFDETTTKVVD